MEEIALQSNPGLVDIASPGEGDPIEYYLSLPQGINIQAYKDHEHIIHVKVISGEIKFNVFGPTNDDSQSYEADGSFTVTSYGFDRILYLKATDAASFEISIA